MRYNSILVNLDIDGPFVPTVKAAIDLARRSQARLIGFCAADAPLPMAGIGGGGLAAQAWQQVRDDIQRRAGELNLEFDALVAGAVDARWMAALDHPTPALAKAARLADLVVMNAQDGAATGDAYRVCDPGSVILQAGRPVLVVPEGAEQVQARRVVLAWKDTREARRAVADAVPLLALASEVTVLAVASTVDEHVRTGVGDVVDFLAGHEIAARPETIESPEESLALLDFIQDSDADLVVSGAYGHSRLRQWAFGGITRSLLDETGVGRFMSN